MKTYIKNKKTNEEKAIKEKKELEKYLKEFPRESDNTKQDNLFTKLVKMSQEELKQYVFVRLKELYGKKNVCSKKGYVYAQGTVPVLLVAHMDTVHISLPTKVYYNKGRVYATEGIGGDDRCGIYMILQLIKKHRCHVLFTEDEEVGGVGAGLFTKTTKYKNMKVNYAIEFDRKGKNDAVFYKCDNPDFTEFILNTNYYVKAFGTYSDIGDVAPYLGVAAVNLSCGYYNAHTIKEYVVLDEMYESIKQAENLIVQQVDEPFVYIERKTYGLDKWSYGSYYDDYYAGYYDDCYGYATFKKEIPEGSVLIDHDYNSEGYETGLKYSTVYLEQDRVCNQEKIYHFICENVTYEIIAVTEKEAWGMLLTSIDIKKEEVLEVLEF